MSNSYYSFQFYFLQALATASVALLLLTTAFLLSSTPILGSCLVAGALMMDGYGLFTHRQQDNLCTGQYPNSTIQPTHLTHM